jgi:hypothetical protein
MLLKLLILLLLALFGVPTDVCIPKEFTAARRSSTGDEGRCGGGVWLAMGVPACADVGVGFWATGFCVMVLCVDPEGEFDCGALKLYDCG